MPLTSPEALVAAGLLPADQAPALQPVADRFAIAVTDHIAGLIDPAVAHDPIARQFLPRIEELQVKGEERHDPIGDDAFSPVPGIVHRYPDRVLLKITQLCPVYCRFCFRRELIGPGSEGLSLEQLTAALDYIAEHREVWEVILTGGDPLVLSPRRLAMVLDRLETIPHVATIRIHSRVPVVDPDRIDDELLLVMKRRKPVWLLLHANHAREFSPAARAAIARLVDGGVPMLGQTVLLRGVNDDPATLTDLFRAMVECRIKPHYLHHADLARGTAHFRVPIARGRALVRALRGRLSGLCQPTYMLDIPGGHGKVPIGPEYLDAGSDHFWQVTDYRGTRHRYHEVLPD